MIFHGASTRGVFECVYFFTAEARCILAILTMLLHDAEIFPKNKVQTNMVLAQRKYTIDVI